MRVSFLQVCGFGEAAHAPADGPTPVCVQAELHGLCGFQTEYMKLEGGIVGGQRKSWERSHMHI